MIKNWSSEIRPSISNLSNKKMFHTCFGWLYDLKKAARRQRDIYRREGFYTVPDNMVEDTKIIKSANLPMVWILAAPGTPCIALVHRLADLYGLYHMNIGALLQREMSLETERENEVHHLMHRGIAIPRSFVFEIIRRQMANVCQRKKHRGFILTEYPSTLSQAANFFDHIWKPDFIIYVETCDKVTHQNVYVYLKFQVRASKVLRKLHPDIHAVSLEQTQKFKRNMDRIAKKYPKHFKRISASISLEDLCRELMKWIERSAVMHDIMPPLFVEPPLGIVDDEDDEMFDE